MATHASRGPSVTRRMIIMLLLVGLLLAALVGWNVMGQVMMKKAVAAMTAPPQTVTAMVAAVDDWQPTLAAVGSLRAVQGAELALDVGGLVRKVSLQSGARVEAGELLLQLEDADVRARVRQADADAALAKVTFERMRKQLASKAISQAMYDQAAADLKVREAALQQARATADKYLLHAPFAGRAGVVKLSPGSFLPAGTAVVTLQQLDPMFVDFHLPQGQLGQLRLGQRVTLQLDAWPDRKINGRISAIDPKVDANTRNVLVEATVPNPDDMLLPGMFVDVSVEVGAPESHLTLPQSAIAFNPYGATVFVVDHQKSATDAAGRTFPTAHQVFVTTGARRGDQVAVLDGINPGDEVVTSGQLKLKNGTPLIIDNSHPPPNQAAPRPQEH